MVASPKKSLALDTNLLLDLAGNKDFAHEFKDEFSGRGYSLLVPPTVVAELAFLASLNDAPQQEIANIALEKINIWKCQPFRLSSTQLATAIRFSARLMDSSLIPETEQNDGKIWRKHHWRRFHCSSLLINIYWILTRKRCCSFSTMPISFRFIRRIRNGG
jgi:hypothetical protein